MDFIKSKEQLVWRRLRRESRKTQSENKASFFTVLLHCIYIWQSLKTRVKNGPVRVMSSLSAAQTSVCLLQFGGCSSLTEQRLLHREKNMQGGFLFSFSVNHAVHSAMKTQNCASVACWLQCLKRKARICTDLLELPLSLHLFTLFFLHYFHVRFFSLFIEWCDVKLFLLMWHVTFLSSDSASATPVFSSGAVCVVGSSDVQLHLLTVLTSYLLVLLFSPQEDVSCHASKDSRSGPSPAVLHRHGHRACGQQEIQVPSVNVLVSIWSPFQRFWRLLSGRDIEF